MSEKLNQTPEPEQGTETEQEQEAIDPVVLLGQELRQINAANSALLKRLNELEVKLTQPERERSLPPTITHSQLRSAAWMRKHGVQLEDIGSGRIQVIPDSKEG